MEKVDKVRKARLATVWRKKHRDFKGKIDGVKYVMCFVPGTGTCSVPLDSLTDKQIEEMGG